MYPDAHEVDLGEQNNQAVFIKRDGIGYKFRDDPDWDHWFKVAEEEKREEEELKKQLAAEGKSMVGSPRLVYVPLTSTA
jgi:hypothetical protein